MHRFLRRRLRKRYASCWFLLSIVSLAISNPTTAEVLTGTDESAQLPFWEWRSQSLSIRLVQRLPDQTRAYFSARGFPREHAEAIAQSCVFQTVFKNTAPAGKKDVIEYDLRQWKIHSSHTPGSLKLREDWSAEWQRKKVTQAARIAFEWSLLPTHQRYQAGDYNWGMTTYNLAPGARFDLLLTWTLNGEIHQGTISDIQCAPDKTVEPNTPLS
ncbi:hypothetical protein [Kaarinaea lacus]